MLAKLWKKSPQIQCGLCSHFCIFDEEQSIGKCGVRKLELNQNSEPELISTVANQIISYNADPVEKKPLYHYLPQTKIFSIGTMGCNFDCAWCQNDSISRAPSEGLPIKGIPASPEQVVQVAIESGSQSIAFTYNEPTVFFEFMEMCAHEALKAKLSTAIVSNGYQSLETLNHIKDFIHAANIDLKSFSSATYEKYCKATIKPVLNTLKYLKKHNIWLEVCTLVIPTINDSEKELKDIATFIAQELGTDTPWHVSAFHPARNLKNIPNTPVETLTKAFDIGKNAGLEYVYIGNTSLSTSTHCPKCHNVLIERKGFYANPLQGFEGVCPHCQTPIAGLWKI